MAGARNWKIYHTHAQRSACLQKPVAWFKSLLFVILVHEAVEKRMTPVDRFDASMVFPSDWSNHVKSAESRALTLRCGIDSRAM